MSLKLAQALACAAALCGSAAAWAAENGTLPLPRFVSLRAEEVNLRTGPGVRYPVDWIYARRDLPVEVIAEFEDWRRIRDWQGTEGWVHKNMLSGRRMAVVMGATRTLRRDPADTARPAAMLEAGVVGRLKKCPRDTGWCEVELDGAEGWLKRGEFWGVYPNESFD